MSDASEVKDVTAARDPRKAVRKFTGPEIFQQMKDEEYLYWAGVAAAESFAAGHQMSVEGFHAKGYTADGSGLKRVAVRVERP